MLILLTLLGGSICPALASADAGTKVVRYRGYGIRVPAAWPVYNLSADPTVCVRFNRHAVYLGRPGSEQLCRCRWTRAHSRRQDQWPGRRLPGAA
jgi:hypothetical protein